MPHKEKKKKLNLWVHIGEQRLYKRLNPGRVLGLFSRKYYPDSSWSLL